MDTLNPFALDYVEPKQDDIFDAFDRERIDAPKPDHQPAKAAAPKKEHSGKRGMVIHDQFEQGSEAWLQARCGLLTASEMKLIITPTLKIANNDKVKIHLYELLAQRVTNYVEPHFQSYDMERGNFDEEHARGKYRETYAPVTECGFITNDKWGFTIGYSPDGLVGDDGLIECKSRVQKWQMKTLVENVSKGEIPDDYVMQIQTGLLVSERKWCDFISYSGGMVMPVVRVFPIPEIQDAILAAAADFEARLADARAVYDNLIASDARLIPTERLMQL